MRLIDCLYALAKFPEAARACEDAVRCSPSFKAIPEYKVREGGEGLHVEGGGCPGRGGGRGWVEERVNGVSCE